MSSVESTYKSRETEEWLDIKFYRPFGYMIAKLCQRFNIKPNTVSLFGLLLGILGSHLIYYTDIELTVAGIVLLVISNAMDSADGQLARMTNNRTRFGRILDGFVTNLIFLSVYIHLCLKMTSDDSLLVWIVALIAAISHSLQSAVADHYRNGYLYFVISPDRAELDSSEKLKEQFAKMKWGKYPFEKAWGLIYLNYTNEQEMLSPRFSELMSKAKRLFQGKIPLQFSELYSAYSRPHVKYYNILTTNTRMITLFLALLINIPWIYLAFEIIVLNALLLHVVLHQESASRKILTKLKSYEENVSSS